MLPILKSVKCPSDLFHTSDFTKANRVSSSIASSIAFGIDVALVVSEMVYRVSASSDIAEPVPDRWRGLSRPRPFVTGVGPKSTAPNRRSGRFDQSTWGTGSEDYGGVENMAPNGIGNWFKQVSLSQ
jgi:hypothetical protein